MSECHKNMSKNKDKGHYLQHILNGSFGLYILGLIYDKQGKVGQAIKCYQMCNQQDKFIWNSYERLLRLETKQERVVQIQNYDNSNFKIKSALTKIILEQ